MPAWGQSYYIRPLISTANKPRIVMMMIMYFPPLWYWIFRLKQNYLFPDYIKMHELTRKVFKEWGTMLCLWIAPLFISTYISITIFISIFMSISTSTSITISTPIFICLIKVYLVCASPASSSFPQCSIFNLASISIDGSIYISTSTSTSSNLKSQS